ncbi:hypothetical protein FDI69_gp008 [Rhodococcus phage Trina]|uniref:Uncharacterized protein n=1 Tax=Rhodococcus phage Trina TaxID=2027905 RepID=A0A2D1A3V6_9CAUD|nr:hypothetical protein FDI69_gp008 [Rhodococcus phage Trina]ASZ74826.1 hypothetical protein SEA_TRINA_8 [Rhodococcus phage Trina]
MLTTRERTITEYVIEQDESAFQASRRGLEKAAREIIIADKNSLGKYKHEQWWDVPQQVWQKWLADSDLSPLFEDYNIVALLAEKALNYRSR